MRNRKLRENDRLLGEGLRGESKLITIEGKEMFLPIDIESGGLFL